MDYLRELGALALASRMKRLVGILNQEIKGIYLAEQIEFEPLLMPVTRLLKAKGRLAVNQIVDHLGISQPAVTQLCSLLTKHALIDIQTDPLDQRKRIVSLTRKGEAKAKGLEPVWMAVQQAVSQMILTSENNLLSALLDFETRLEQEPLKERVLILLQKQREALIEVIAYEPTYLNDFKDLNYEWINNDFVVEPSDHRVLSQPQEQIIDNGGFVFLARRDNKIVGTYALIRIIDTEYELSKMAVTAAYQQKGIGTRLLDHALAQARLMKLEKLVVYSHTNLAPAINLYFKKGFRVVPKDDYHNNRANIKMELQFHR